MESNQVSPSANWLQELLGWFKFLFSLLVIWCVLAMLPGCKRPAAALGSVWMGGLKIGCGVLVGIPDGDRTHVAFLTARHVATANGFFRLQSKSNAVYLNSGGAFRCRRIGNIAPERWFCSKEKNLDFAWFELTPEELNILSKAGDLPPHVSLADYTDSENSSTVAIHDGKGMSSIIEGDIVSVARTFDMPYFGSGLRFPPFLSTPVSVIFTQMDSGMILKRWQDCIVELPLNSFMSTMAVRQCVLQMSTHQSDSGAPVFINGKSDCPRLLGIMITAKLNQGISGFLPLQATEEIRKSMMAGSGTRLIDKKEFW